MIRFVVLFLDKKMNNPMALKASPNLGRIAEAIMYVVHGVCKCMMYIKRSVYKWDPRIETWDWSCRPAVSFYQNLDRAAKKDTKTENLLKSDPTRRN